MRLSVAVGAVLAASLSTASANSCSDGSAEQIGGNWYCSAVKSITYKNFKSSGTYNEVTSMEGGKCSSQPKHYSGSLAPLDKEHSFHIRGPAALKQLAVYAPGSSSDKRHAKPTLHERRHGHQHHHARRDEHMRKVVNPGEKEEKEQPEPQPTPDIQQKAQGGSGKSSSGGDDDDDDDDDKKKKGGLGSFVRQAYYDARSSTAKGLVFLNHHGGENSGTFDYELGNSLSYASSDGLAGAASPQVLNDMIIPDNKEIIIMSDKKCDGDCGTVRPDTVAHHGFDGESKLYLVELEMPLSGQKGFNADMSAAWILNAQIPRTLQYGNAECSCWESGCGEFDILEVLDPGNHRCKSTFHGKKAGGDSNFINRPTDGPVKFAVFFNKLTSSVHIKTLDNDIDFADVFTLGDIIKFVVEEVVEAVASVFTLGA